MRENLTVEKAFMKDVRKTKRCWEWAGAYYVNGYGRVSFNSRQFLAHRFSYFLFNKTFDESLIIMHKCDNPKCVNPHHLVIGTHQDNMTDKVSKRRCPSGQDHGMARLKDEHVREIHKTTRHRYWTNAELAKMYGVSRACIINIRSGKSWPYIYKEMVG